MLKSGTYSASSISFYLGTVTDVARRGTLFPFTNSWWNGSNVPGKKAENMTYIAGIHNYEAECRATMVEWKGFNVVGGAAPAKASEKSATVTTAEIDNVAVGVGA
jgi:hypothetical protein